MFSVIDVIGWILAVRVAIVAVDMLYLCYSSTFREVEPVFAGAKWWELLLLPAGVVQHRLDQRNPRELEIQEHLQGLKALRGKRGDLARKKRRKLSDDLTELRKEPKKRREIDDTAYTEMIAPYLDGITEMKRAMDESLEERARIQRALN